MMIAFYLAALIAVYASVRVILGSNAVHALLHLIVSLLSAALLFFLLGAPFAAALEVIVYAGAIMVLFVFVVMMLNLGPNAGVLEKSWITPRTWVGPAVLAFVLLAELTIVLASGPAVSKQAWQRRGPDRRFVYREGLPGSAARGPAQRSALAGVASDELPPEYADQPVEQPGLITPKQVGVSLFGPYILAVELASLLLLAGLVGAYHLGRKEPAK